MLKRKPTCAHALVWLVAVYACPEDDRAGAEHYPGPITVDFLQSMINVILVCCLQSQNQGFRQQFSVGSWEV